MKTIGRNIETGAWEYVSDPDLVRFAELCQVLKAEPREMPFNSNYGIPAQESVMSRIFPDYWMMKVQSQFVQFFLSLIISRDKSADFGYRVEVTLNNGNSFTQLVR